jgi:hypothetical protein
LLKDNYNKISKILSYSPSKSITNSHLEIKLNLFKFLTIAILVALIVTYGHSVGQTIFKMEHIFLSILLYVFIIKKFSLNKIVIFSIIWYVVLFCLQYFMGYLISVTEGLNTLLWLFLNILFTFTIVKELDDHVFLSISHIIIKLFLILTALAFFVRFLNIYPWVNILWRTHSSGFGVNDVFRLQLFNNEPAGLGITVIFSFIIIDALEKNNKNIFCYFLFSTFILLLTYSLSAFIVFFVYLFIRWNMKSKFFKRKFYNFLFSFFIILLIGWSLFYFYNNGVLSNNINLNRLIQFTSQENSSGNYRVFYPLRTIIEKFNLLNFFVGKGIGQREYYFKGSQYFSILSNFPNSFPNWFFDTGLLGFMIIFYMVFYSVVRNKKNNLNIILPIWSAILVYQLGAGYFVSPLIWFMYGFILKVSNANKKCGKHMKTYKIKKEKKG